MAIGKTYSFFSFVLALTVLAGLAACNKIDDLDPDNGWSELGGDRPVSFNSSLTTTATKATTTLQNNTTFGVFAFYQPGTSGSPGSWSPSTRTPNFMFNQPVLFELSDSYTYTPVRYWPSNEYNTITFWAYCPYTASPDFLAANSTAAYTKSSVGLPDIRYTADGTTDLLVSDVVTDKTYSNCATAGVVNFDFRHTLSKITFKVKKNDNDPGDTNDYTITLTSIVLKYIYRTGIYSTDHWTSYSNQGNHTVFNSSKEVETDVETVTSLLMIPQAHTASNARLHIEYTISMNSGPAQAFHSECNLKEIVDGSHNPISSWDENGQYTYTITISPGMPITFEVSWDPWGDDYHWSLTT